MAMNYSILMGTTATFFVVATAAFAVGLTDADHDYLVTQNVERGSPVVKGLSPKEQARLHGLINDSRTESDPTARAMRRYFRDGLECRARHDRGRCSEG
jgi:hypothetical protein